MKKQRTYLSIYFDLPFLVNVGDGFKDKSLEEWFEKIKNGEDDLPESKYIPKPSELKKLTFLSDCPAYIPQDPLCSTFIIPLEGDIEVGIQFLTRINYSNTAIFFGEVPGDRFGMASYSSVRVNFPLDKIEYPEGDDGDFVDIAISATNHFLDHYRNFDNRYWIRPISRTSSFDFWFFETLSDGTQNRRSASYSLPKVNGFGLKRLQGEREKEFRKIVESKEKPNIVNSLRLEAIGLYESQEYRLACIESAVFFETWLHVFIRNCYRFHGLSDTAIDAKFVNSRGRPESAHFIAEKLIKDASGFDFSSTSEFENWKSDTKDLRNDLVHGKKHDVTREEAKKSLDSAIAGAQLVEKNVVLTRR